MKVLVTGGGTGGHIYPALALVREIKKYHSDAEFLYVGTENGLESKIVPNEGIPFETIKIQGFKRSLSPKNFETIYLFLKSIRDAKKIIRKFQPDIVIGTGGYVCGSVVYAASKLKIPTMIHEQNSVPGLTNKFLSRYVDKICVCFTEVMTDFPEKKVVLTGNPRGQEVAGIQKSSILEEFSLDPKKPTVLIFGGSRGAAKLNQAFKEGVKALSEKDYQVLYASGETYYEKLEEAIKELDVSLKNVTIRPYIKNMEQVLANVQLVVGRSGATTLSEITALGLPSILVPSPNVTNDQQTKNAQSLVNVGAAVLVKDSELTGEKLVSEIDGLMTNQDQLDLLAKASKAQGIPDATKRLYDVMMSLLAK